MQLLMHSCSDFSHVYWLFTKQNLGLCSACGRPATAEQLCRPKGCDSVIRAPSRPRKRSEPQKQLQNKNESSLSDLMGTVEATFFAHGNGAKPRSIDGLALAPVQDAHISS